MIFYLDGYVGVENSAIINSTELPAESVQASSRAISRVPSQTFSQSGHLRDRLIERCTNLNSRVALFNCPVMGFMTARLLEKGEAETPPIDRLYTPRPMNIDTMTNDWSMGKELADNRGYFTMSGITKKELDEVLKTSGPGSHAVVLSSSRHWLGQALGMRHIWNYVYLGNQQVNGSKEPSEEMKDQYSVIDSYYGVHTGEQYFNSYEDNLEVGIFANKSPNMDELFVKMQDKIDIMKNYISPSG